MRRTHIIPVCFCVALLGLHASASWASTADEYVRAGYQSFVSRSWDKAIDSYTKAIELNPRNADAYFQRGLACDMANRLDDAIKDYEKTLELSANHYLAMEYLAKLYEAKGNYENAVDLYARSLPLVDDPKWKSLIKVWISEAHRKIREEPDSAATGQRPNQPGLSSGERKPQ
jgi:tetratricopeptide (TPR) repeat protein